MFRKPFAGLTVLGFPFFVTFASQSSSHGLSFSDSGLILILIVADVADVFVANSIPRKVVRDAS